MAEPTQREYLEQRIAYERELTNQRFDLIEHARVLQAREYERRLETLNQEAARILVVQHSTVSSDTWVGFIKDYDAWRTSVNKELQTTTTRLATWAAAIVVLVAIIGLVLRFFGV